VADSATVVLVHGAWHGAWCWEKVMPLLDAAGIASTAVELPLTSWEDDAAATTAAIEQVDGPVVLCGHSYGGSVITGAGDLPNVQRLVYLAAFALEEGESLANAAVDSHAPSTGVENVLVFSDDGTTVDLDHSAAGAFFYHDCEPDDMAAAVARLRPMQFACLGTAVATPAWKSKPSTYVVCTEDRAVHPALQRAMATRCTSSVDFPTAHSPFLNHPDLVTDLLIELARA
jgi:pimeloyl-ACP methyl ester carboxylesterase